MYKINDRFSLQIKHQEKKVIEKSKQKLFKKTIPEGEFKGLDIVLVDLSVI